jgi:hypothetical protein
VAARSPVTTTGGGYADGGRGPPVSPSAADQRGVASAGDSGRGLRTGDVRVDEDLHQRIEALVAEEHELRRAHPAGSGPDAAEQSRLLRIEVSLDRTWDLLRQRQARRDAGQDVSAAAERRADVVEGYLG